MKGALSKLWIGFAVAALPLAISGAEARTDEASKAGGGEAVAAGKSPKQKAAPGAELFDSPLVPHFKIEISTTALEDLRKDPRRYVSAQIEVDAKGEGPLSPSPVGRERVGVRVFRNVAIHLKGAAGSFRSVDDKPALTLNFDKFTPDQNLFGLGKIHLNNSVQDPSYLTECLCSGMFRAAGVPAARVAHATVEINRRNLGLYVLKEGFNKDFLRQYFKKTSGNFYDGGYLTDIDEKLEKDGGDGPDDWSDLEPLRAAAKEPDPVRRWQKLPQALDVDRFISFLVVENMTWHWDGYTMNRNNYRLYFNKDENRLVFLPHGLDQMFWEPRGPLIANINGLVAKAVMNTEEGKALYLERYRRLYTNVFRLEVLTNTLAQVSARVRATLQTQNPEAGKQYPQHAERILRLIVGRSRSLARQLHLAPPASLVFTNHTASLTGLDWQPVESDGAHLEATHESDGRATLCIRADSNSSGSWRIAVPLPTGRYRLEGRVKGDGIVASRDETGAGLRVSGQNRQAGNALTGSSDWKPIACEFEVAEDRRDVILICELRASKGEARFDLESLQLVRLK